MKNKLKFPPIRLIYESEECRVGRKTRKRRETEKHNDQPNTACPQSVSSDMVSRIAKEMFEIGLVECERVESGGAIASEQTQYG